MIRGAVWLLLFHFGVDLWIFPNFFNDTVDFLDSFRPIVSFNKRDDDIKMFFMRIASAIGLVFLLY